MVSDPFLDKDRREIIPEDIRQYFERRYGPDIEVEERNRFLTKDSRPEELIRTLWVIHESPQAREKFQSQLRKLKQQT